MSFDGVTLKEVADFGLVSIAAPIGGEKKLIQAVKKSYGCDLPAVGSSDVSKNSELRMLGLQPGQWFAFFPHAGDDALSSVSEKLGMGGYYTDQSDSWAVLEISGERAREALERICPLDLHPTAFPKGAVSRTVMEHLGVINLRTGEDTFTLMSARSSAQSFLHAVETSIRNVI